jgi:hypothetical protein
LPFDRPGDIQSIPCDGKPHNVDSPELEWSCQPNDRVPGVLDKDIPFEKPGDFESTPRTKQSGKPGPDNKPLDWTHYPGGKKPDVEDKDLPLNRPSDLRSVPHNVRSIPRDGKPRDEDHPELVFQMKRFLVTLIRMM